MIAISTIIIICLLCGIVSAVTFDSFGVQTVKARTEEFTDSNNNLHVSLQAPDTWNSGTAAATIHNLTTSWVNR
jgi:hypothetical protein